MHTVAAKPRVIERTEEREEEKDADAIACFPEPEGFTSRLRLVRWSCEAE